MEMSRISATTDIVFKYLFGAKTSTELLRAFVNAVQRHAGLGEFSSLEIMNPIGERDFVSAKLTVIDIKAKSADGTVVNVEVQVRSQAEYGERSLYYWAQSYTEQIAEGDEYTRLKPVVSVSILNFPLFPLPEFHTTFHLTEKDHPDLTLTEDCVLHYLELPKLPSSSGSELAEWLYALKHLDEQEGPIMVLLEKNHSLQELAQRYRHFEMDPDARLAYNDRMKFLHDQASLIGTAQRKGRAEGLAEARAEARQATITMAKALLAEGIDRVKVLALTKLSEEDLAEWEI